MDLVVTRVQVGLISTPTYHVMQVRHGHHVTSVLRI